MIEHMSLKIAKQLKTINPEETPSVDIMRYSIKFLLLNTITISLVVLSGILIGDLTDVLISLIGFAGLRFFSGGYHVSTAWLCAIVSCSLLQMNVFMSHYVFNDQVILIVIQVIALILVSIYAPSNIEKQTNFKKENYIWLKVISIILISINLLYINNEMLASAFFFQGLTLINIKGRR